MAEHLARTLLVALEGIKFTVIKSPLCAPAPLQVPALDAVPRLVLGSLSEGIILPDRCQNTAEVAH